MCTSSSLVNFRTPLPSAPAPLQTNITFPSNIGNNINAVSYNYASGSGSTAYLNGTYTVNCSSSEGLPSQNGGVLCVFNSNGSTGTYFWGSQYGGGYIGCTSSTVSGTASPYPYSAYVYVDSGTPKYNTITTGEWVSIQLPYYIKPTSFNVQGRNYNAGGGRTYPRNPNGYLFQGSTNGTTWTTLYTQAVPALGTAGISVSTGGGSNFTVSTVNSFNRFRFIILSIVGSGVSSNPQGNSSLCWMSITGDSYSSAI